MSGDVNAREGWNMLPGRKEKGHCADIYRVHTRKTFSLFFRLKNMGEGKRMRIFFS